MMEVLQRGQPPVQAAALALLRAVFAVPGVRMGAPASLTAHLMAPLPPLLSSPHSRLAQQVLLALGSLLLLRATKYSTRLYSVTKQQKQSVSINKT